MPATPPSAVKTILKSNWDDLNDHLIAKFYEVDRKGKSIGNIEVWAPLTEANFEMALSWNSPFENSGAESKAPALLAMLQSGAFQPLLDAVFGDGQKNGKNGQANASELSKKSSEFMNQFEGRTGITKLNSTQVFTGMAPAKIPIVALFRAWINPAKEVEAPIDQLVNWSLPEVLSPDGTIISRGIEAGRGNLSSLDVLLPSKAPTMIAMRYKGKTYAPLVIESIGQPISSPVDSQGKHVSMLVPMMLCSIAALDRDDWKGWNVASR